MFTKHMLKLFSTFFVLTILTFNLYAAEMKCGTNEISNKVFRQLIGSNATLIENSFFSGVETYSLNGEIHYGVAGRYIKPQNEKTFVVLILTCKNGEFYQAAKYEFYGDSLDFLRYDTKTQKLFVVFKDETELYGWIVRIGSEYKFEMFEDPEL